MSNGKTDRVIITSTGGKLHPWEPGQSGNPAGRPKGAVGLARYIREHSLDGRVLADFLLRLVHCEGVVMDLCKVTMDHRLEAVRILLNRGFGRPVEQLVVEGGASSISDIIAQVYARRQAAIEASADEQGLKAVPSVVVEGEGGSAGVEAQGSADGGEDGKGNSDRDSKAGDRKRGAGGPS